MARKLRIGIAGFGGIGHLHAAIYQNLPHCELVAVADCNPAKLASESGDINLGLPTRVDLTKLHRHTSIEAMLDGEKLDYLDVALPTDLHSRYAVCALKRGLDVFCEKPMARTLPEAEAMLAAVRSSGRQLMIGQCLRFWPCYELLLAVRRAGTYGALRMLTLSRISEISPKEWMHDGRRSGGAAWDLHLHDVDFVHALLGMPRAVTATGCTRHTGEIDNIHALYRYPGELTVASEASWGSVGFRMGYRAIFEDAVLRTADNGARVLLCRRGLPEEELPLAPGNGHGRELAYYTKVLLEGGRPERCLPEDSYGSLRIAAAEIASARQGGEWLVP